MRPAFFLSIITSIFLVSGCSTRGNKVYTKPSKQKTLILYGTNDKYKTKVLYSEFDKWNGAPYKLGGTSLRGVDCSSFIQQVYYDAFGLKVPRTTLKQLQVGHKIPKSELRIGDMIFFKTSFNVRHVGIIILDGEFIHASTSQGVTISSIYNPYWVDKYYQSRRILP